MPTQSNMCTFKNGFRSVYHSLKMVTAYLFLYSEETGIDLSSSSSFWFPKIAKFKSINYAYDSILKGKCQICDTEYIGIAPSDM